MPNRRGSVCLWFAYPDDLQDEGAFASASSLLSKDELSRSQGFRFDRDRREFIASRALVRSALSYFHPIAPDEWAFQFNAFGKPNVHHACGLNFNLSHTSKLVACCVVVDGEVGIDVERQERAQEILELGEEIFSAVEQGQIEALTGDEKGSHALSLWTLKEAYIKARGVGFSLPVNQVTFIHEGTSEIRLQLESPLCGDDRQWKFCLFDFAGHRVAIAVEKSTQGQLQLMEARPPFASAVPLAADRVRWMRSSTGST
jgi:4'-phosphopantetheinyl transferase